MKHFILIKAYRNWLESNNLIEESPLPGLEHLTGDQLFFVNFAQVKTIDLIRKQNSFHAYNSGLVRSHPSRGTQK